MSKYAANNKADTAVKLVLIFFISLLSFSVGTYVGKQVSDSDARRAALEADYNTEAGGEATAKSEDHVADEATAPISDDEVASLTEEFAKPDRTVASEGVPSSTTTATSSLDTAAASHEAETKPAEAESYTHVAKMNTEAEAAVDANVHADRATASTTPTAKATAPTATNAAAPATTTPATVAKTVNEPQTAAARVAENKAPAADVKAVRPPSSALPSVATTAVGKYTVQVASYATEAEAKEQAATLTSKGYSAFYVPAEINGKVWYRVSIGLFGDQKSATTYRTELLSKQAVSTAIVQKIVK